MILIMRIKTQNLENSPPAGGLEWGMLNRESEVKSPRLDSGSTAGMTELRTSPG